MGWVRMRPPFMTFQASFTIFSYYKTLNDVFCRETSISGLYLDRKVMIEFHDGSQMLSFLSIQSFPNDFFFKNFKTENGYIRWKPSQYFLSLASRKRKRTSFPPTSGKEILVDSFFTDFPIKYSVVNLIVISTIFYYDRIINSVIIQKTMTNRSIVPDVWSRWPNFCETLFCVLHNLDRNSNFAPNYGFTEPIRY